MVTLFTSGRQEWEEKILPFYLLDFKLFEFVSHFKRKKCKILKDHSPNDADKLGLVDSGFRESWKHSIQKCLLFLNSFLIFWWASREIVRPGTTYFYLICELIMISTF